MGEERESLIAILAALLVLFTAMLDPRISSGLAVLFLAILGGYKFFQSRRSCGW